MASGYTQLNRSQSRLLPHGLQSTTSLNSANPFSDPGPSSISGKFNLSPDVRAWGATVDAEDDDWLHDPRKGRKLDSRGTIFTFRGIANVGCLAILALGLTSLFAGYPLVDYFTRPKLGNLGGYNLGGINATGQVFQQVFTLIDPDTPPEVMKKRSLNDPSVELQLVFSDEFNKPGRSFYPGDDPFWEAVDLNYWSTWDVEWYDPGQVTTEDGYLKITVEKVRNHGLNYRSGMLSTWNKFCFTGGLIEASVMLPGTPDVSGFWPAVWTMGNLGRAGFGASVEGLWPYSYDACDVGTMPNQTLHGGPAAALNSGTDPNNDFALSFLPGQRLSSCTCPGEQHPGPVHRDGTYVARSAPEIDILEATINPETLVGEVSQSAQWAPFDAAYQWRNRTYMTINDPEVSRLNTYMGGIYQQASSVLSTTNAQAYQGTGGTFAVYGYEYKPGTEADGSFITWINNDKQAWTYRGGGTGPNALTGISERPVPREPLYILMNVGMSDSFSPISPEMVFPGVMKVDYVRVYQPSDAINYGCDPVGFPTSNYIDQFTEAYTNPNLTTWVDDFGQAWPKNSLVDAC